MHGNIMAFGHSQLPSIENSHYIIWMYAARLITVCNKTFVVTTNKLQYNDLSHICNHLLIISDVTCLLLFVTFLFMLTCFTPIHIHQNEHFQQLSETKKKLKNSNTTNLRLSCDDRCANCGKTTSILPTVCCDNLITNGSQYL